MCASTPLECDYLEWKVILSMPNYVYKALHTFQRVMSKVLECSPHDCVPIKHSQKVQCLELLDTSDLRSSKDISMAQQVSGIFLCYDIVLENIILPDLSCISSQQSK